MAVVLKPFPWSPNGYDVEYLQVGAERDFGASEPSLADAGYVSIEATPAGPSVGDETPQRRARRSK